MQYAPEDQEEQPTLETLLAEACELGQVMFDQIDDEYWEAAVVLNYAEGKTYIFGNGKFPAEALQAALTKANEVKP